MEVGETANRNRNVRSLEDDVAMDFCFLTVDAVLDQSGNKTTHFWPTEASADQPPGCFDTWVVDVVEGQHGGGPEPGGQKWPENPG